MSGGHFNYEQSWMMYLREKIEREIKHPNEYTMELINDEQFLEELKDIAKQLDLLYNRVQDVDKTFSGDHSLESWKDIYLEKDE